MEEIKNKTKVDELDELLEKISIAMDMTRDKQNNIDQMTGELYNEIRPMMVEKMKKEIEQAQNDKVEFDEMTKNALINAKKSILEIKEESEKAYQDKILDTLKRKQEIDRKLSSMKNGKYPEEKIIIAEAYANKAIEKVNNEMEEFKKTHFELIEKLNKYEKDIWNSASEIGVEQEIDSVTLDEKKLNEQEESEVNIKEERLNEHEDLRRRRKEIDKTIEEKIELSETKDVILEEVKDQFRDWIIDKYVYNETDPNKYSASKTIPTREEIIKQMRDEARKSDPDKTMEDVLDEMIGSYISDRINLFKSRKAEPIKAEPVKTKSERTEPIKTGTTKTGTTKTKITKSEPEKNETLGNDKKKITSIEINPFENSIKYDFKEPKLRNAILTESIEIPFNYDSQNTESVIKVLKNFYDEDKIDEVTRSIDPNITKWLSTNNNYDINITDYLNILSGHKDDIDIFYDLRDIYNSDLSRKQIKNVMNIAKNASITSKGCVEIQRDPLFKRIYGNIKKRVEDFHIKLLSQKNEKDKELTTKKTTNNKSGENNKEFVQKLKVDENKARNNVAAKSKENEEVMEIDTSGWFDGEEK